MQEFCDETMKHSLLDGTTGSEKIGKLLDQIVVKTDNILKAYLCCVHFSLPIFSLPDHFAA